jgi:nitroimidazol reductase NimA-like FMN-containing flavoprotein (pyridoxamine 5'-phosphate oxidase superfamily)
MSDFELTTQNRVRRIPARGHYDKAVIYPIIDEALICHVGFVEDGVPYVIPTIHARNGDKLIFHGAKASRMMKQIASGAVICVTFTLLDGLVLARSTFHHSMNYRSAVVFGQGRPLTDDAEKMAALEVLTEHLVHGRWPDSRQPNAKELNATAMAELTIASASAKIRTGPPSDDDEDYAQPIWAGVLPIRQQYLPPIDDPRLGEGLSAPEYVVNYKR